MVISQLLKPGLSIIHMPLHFSLDMSTGKPLQASPEALLASIASAQMTKAYYGLPVHIYGMGSDAPNFGGQSVSESATVVSLVAESGADILGGAGQLESATTASLLQLVIDNEIIAMVYRLLAGIKVDKETLGFEVIKKVSPGGTYIMEDHTIAHMMDEFFYPKVSIRSNFDVWESQGKPTMWSQAHSMVQEILKENNKELLTRDLLSEIKKRFPGIKNVNAIVTQ